MASNHTQTELNETIINNFSEVIKNNPEGFTANINGKLLKFSYGYAVSISNFIFKDAITETELKKIRNLAIYTGSLIGGWRDSDGTFYIDLTLKVDDLETAVKTARMFKQKAIYSFSDNKSIYV